MPSLVRCTGWADWFVMIIVTKCTNYVRWKISGFELSWNSSGTEFETPIRKSLREFMESCLNFKSGSCKYKLMMENRFFGEDLTVTKHEKVRFSLPAREPPNDPLWGLEIESVRLPKDFRQERKLLESLRYGICTLFELVAMLSWTWAARYSRWGCQKISDRSGNS